MTQGLFIAGRRPKSKKEVKEVVESINQWYEHGGDPEAVSALNLQDPYTLVIEATSFFGNEYDGSLANAPRTGQGYTFVGPDPHTNRKFYGSISWDFKNQKWRVK